MVERSRRGTKPGATLLRIDAAFRRAGARPLVLLGLLGVAALLLLVDLGGAEICESSEAVEALGVRDMVTRGRLILPLLDGHEPMFKPPLFHWVATAIAHLAGASQPSEWIIRAPSAICALATIALCVAFVAPRLGRASALLAGLVLLGAYPFLDQGRYGRVDMLLAFLETLSLFLFLWWRAARGRWRSFCRLALAVSLGLGVLAKGPVGAMLPAASIALFLLLERRAAELRELATPVAVILFLLIASSWYVACAVSHDWPTLHRQLGSENLGRFFGRLGSMPVTYYVEPFLLASVPFSLLAPLIVARALRRPATPEEALARRRWPALLATFCVVTFVFFSVAAYKRRAYLLPIWPALSALVPWWIATLGDGERRRRIEGALVAAALVLVAVNAVYVPYKERRDCPAGVLREAAARIEAALGPGEPLLLQGVSVEDASPLLFYLRRPTALAGAIDDPSAAIVFGDSWAGSPATRVVATVGTDWKRLMVVEPRRDRALARWRTVSGGASCATPS